MKWEYFLTASDFVQHFPFSTSFQNTAGIPLKVWVMLFVRIPELREARKIYALLHRRVLLSIEIWIFLADGVKCIPSIIGCFQRPFAAFYWKTPANQSTSMQTPVSVLLEKIYVSDKDFSKKKDFEERLYTKNYIVRKSPRLFAIASKPHISLEL